MREGRAVLGEEVIDVSRDPRERNADMRRRLFRTVLPFVAAAALIAAALGMVAIGHLGNKREALNLADSVLEALEKRITTEVAAWLGPAERAVRLMSELHSTETLGREAGRVRDFGTGLLNAVPQIASVFYGDTEGRFVMARRDGTEAIAVKTIETRPQRRIIVEWRDRTGGILRHSVESDDGFDPRTRPWFKGAMATDGIFWTEIYVFFTDRVPGLTVSRAMPPRDDTPASVVGVDIRLDTLSRFLATLRIGESGKAMILDRAGRLVAFPDADRTIRQDGETLSPVRLDQLQDPVLTRAFDMLRLEGSGRRMMTIGAQRHLVVSTPLDPVIGRDWVLMLVVPEADLVGFVGRTSRTALAAGSLVGLLALLLAILLVREGRRADARTSDLDRNRRDARAEITALAFLATDPEAADPQSSRGLQRITETVARAVSARRVGLWRFAANRRSLIADDMFDAETGLHAAAVRLTAETVGDACAVLAAGQVEIDALHPDQHFSALSQQYLAANGTRHLISVPIRTAAGTVALLWIEDPAADRGGAIAFANASTALLAHRFGHDGTRRATPSAQVERPARLDRHERPGAEPRRSGNAFLGRLAALGVGRERNDVHAFSDLAVVVLVFTDLVALAAPTSEGRPLVADAVRLIRDLMERHGVAYLRLSGESVIAASGFDGDPVAAARRICEASLQLQEGLTNLFVEADQRPAFRIGAAMGPAIGAIVEEEGAGYNLWGEALDAARTLAGTAAEGMIQISEQIHALGTDDFLARPRGRFWLEGSGETATYYLMART